VVNARHLLLRYLSVSLLLGLLVGCKHGGELSATPAIDAPATHTAVTDLSKTQTSNSNEDSRKLVESRESLYNNIYVYQDGPYRTMSFGVNRTIYTESMYNPSNERELPVPYTQFMTTSLMYAKKIDSILEIGSGGGRTSWYLHRSLPNVQITSVELDPQVVELSRKYFGIKDEPNFHVVSKDGRIFLSSSNTKYDVILVDAYRGPFVPFHLLTKEFYQVVKGHLAEGGVVAQNLEPTTMLFDSTINTLHEVFPQIEFYDASGTDQGGNVVIIAYDGVGYSPSELEQLAEKRQFDCHLTYDLRSMLRHRFGLKMVMAGPKPTFDVVDQQGNSTAGINENAKVLTDDFAPVESLKAIAKHNQKWTQSQDTFLRP
jgi:spermidine synthase